MIQLPQSLLVSPLYPVSPSCILFPSGLHLISPYPSFFFCYFVIFNCSLSPFLPSSSRLADFSRPSSPSQFLFLHVCPAFSLFATLFFPSWPSDLPLDSFAPGSPSFCFLAALPSPIRCVFSAFTHFIINSMFLLLSPSSPYPLGKPLRRY